MGKLVSFPPSVVFSLLHAASCFRYIIPHSSSTVHSHWFIHKVKSIHYALLFMYHIINTQVTLAQFRGSQVLEKTLIPEACRLFGGK